MIYRGENDGGIPALCWSLKEGADATEISPRGWDLKKNAKWD